MASPFRKFRKHQKKMLAFFGVGAILLFVVGDAVLQQLGNRRGDDQDSVVVIWSEGEIRQSQLQRLVESQSRLSEFLLAVAEAAERQTEFADVDWLHAMFSRRAPEATAVETMLLAQKAEALGIVVSDKVINDYLETWARKKVSLAQMQQMLAQRKVPEGALFEMLRRELLAHKLLTMISLDNAAATPAELLEYSGRIYRQGEFEFLPIDVGQYIDKAGNPDPTEEQLATFYDQWKDTLWHPELPRPGLKEPYRAQIQYLKADYAEHLERAKASITDEQIREHYEENKNQFEADLLPNIEPDVPDPGEEQGKKDGRDGNDGKTAGKDGPAAKTIEKTADPAAKDSPPGEKKNTPDGKKTPENKAEKKDSPGDKEQSSSQPRTGEAGKFGLDALVHATPVVYQADAPAPPVTKESGDTKTEPVKDPPAKQSPAAGNAKDAQANEEPKKPAPPKIYKPLENVREEIIKKLAQQKVKETIDSTFTRIMTAEDSPRLKYFKNQQDVVAKLAAYQRLAEHMKLFAYEEALDYYKFAENRRQLKPPALPDMQAIARQFGLTAGTTQSLSFLEARESTGFSKTFSFAFMPRALRKFQPADRATEAIAPFIQQTQTDRVEGFRRLLSWFQRFSDDDQNAYVLWKSGDRESYTPELSEIREQVVRAFKLDKARELARAAAEELAQRARDGQGVLAESLSRSYADRIVSPPKFSWYVHDQNDRNRLSFNGDIEGISSPDDDFMEKIFSLQPGEVTVAVNRPQTTCYVARMKSIDATDEARFVNNPSVVNPLVQGDAGEQRVRWIKHFEQEFKLHWERDPDQRGGG